MDDFFAHIRDAYQVPAEMGRQIRFKDMPGVIIGVWGPYLVIQLDVYPLTHCTVHPTWKMEYLSDEGSDQ